MSSVICEHFETLHSQVNRENELACQMHTILKGLNTISGVFNHDDQFYQIFNHITLTEQKKTKQKTKNKEENVKLRRQKLKFASSNSTTEALLLLLLHCSSTFHRH